MSSSFHRKRSAEAASGSGDAARAVDRRRRRGKGRVQLSRRVGGRGRQLEGHRAFRRRRRFDHRRATTTSRSSCSNLPETPRPKRIYRTDATRRRRLPARRHVTDGTQSSYFDTTADDERSRDAADRAVRAKHRPRAALRVSLNNVSEIRAPSACNDTNHQRRPRSTDDSRPTDDRLQLRPTLEPRAL